MGSRRHPRSWNRAAVVAGVVVLAMGGGFSGLAFAGCRASDPLTGEPFDGNANGANDGAGGNGGGGSLGDASGDRGLEDGPHFDQSLVVTTSLGPVQGALDLGVPSFRGIPYAAPPVGELRWSAPVPPTAWTTPVDATSFTSTCIQLDTEGNLLAGGSEDCLTLNVWTPTHGDLDAGAKLPVLAFIHGGYFVKGGATYQWHDELVYDGAALAAFAHAVVVTIQYRLGAFGFLAHPALSTTAAPHGNYGLLRSDRRAAVRADGNVAALRRRRRPTSPSSGSRRAAARSPRSSRRPWPPGLCLSRAIIESGGFSAYSVATGTSDSALVAAARRLRHGERTSPPALRAIPADASDAAASLPDSALGPARWHFLVDGYALPDDPLSLFTAGHLQPGAGPSRHQPRRAVGHGLRLPARRQPADAERPGHLRERRRPRSTRRTRARSSPSYPYAAYSSAPDERARAAASPTTSTPAPRGRRRAPWPRAASRPIRYLFVHSLDAGRLTADGGAGTAVLRRVPLPRGALRLPRDELRRTSPSRPSELTP